MTTGRRRPTRSRAGLGRLVEACRALPPPRGRYPRTDPIVSVAMLPIDWRTTLTILDRASRRYGAKHGRRIRSVAGLSALLGRFDDTRKGNEAAALDLWGYRYWNRAAILRRLVAYFLEAGVDTPRDLRRWAARSDFDRDFRGRVRGLSLALYNNLRISLGADTIKPDVHVMRFVKSVTGRNVAERETVDLLVRTAARLGIPARDLDLRIWEHQRGVPPRPLSPRGRP